MLLYSEHATLSMSLKVKCSMSLQVTCLEDSSKQLAKTGECRPRRRFGYCSDLVLTSFSDMLRVGEQARELNTARSAGLVSGVACLVFSSCG